MPKFENKENMQVCVLPSLPELISHYLGVLGNNFPKCRSWASIALCPVRSSAQIGLSFLASLVAGTPGTGFSAKAAGFSLI